jgi:hypothetical protein
MEMLEWRGTCSQLNIRYSMDFAFLPLSVIVKDGLVFVSNTCCHIIMQRHFDTISYRVKPEA